MSDCKHLEWNNVHHYEEHGKNGASWPAVSLTVATQGVMVLFNKCQKMHHEKLTLWKLSGNINVAVCRLKIYKFFNQIRLGYNCSQTSLDLQISKTLPSVFVSLKQYQCRPVFTACLETSGLFQELCVCCWGVLQQVTALREGRKSVSLLW